MHGRSQYCRYHFVMTTQGHQRGRLHKDRLLEQVSTILMQEWPGGSALSALSLPEGIVPAITASSTNAFTCLQLTVEYNR